jgi:hypothetical protein
MERAQLIQELKLGHERFILHVLAMPADQLAASHNGKWSPVQHLDHIRRAVKPLAMAMLLPKWFLRRWVGKPNRPTRTYEELVARYKHKLAAGGKASGAFVPPQLEARMAVALAYAVRKQVSLLIKRLVRWSEADLDSTLMPHPLLGKVTVREMLYFTIYHVQHHQALVERDDA